VLDPDATAGLSEFSHIEVALSVRPPAGAVFLGCVSWVRVGCLLAGQLSLDAGWAGGVESRVQVVASQFW